MISSEHLVSVIVPCYNYGHLLNETLHSVAAQTHTNFECLIINDGSTDNSKEIAEEWCRKDARFQLINQSNIGLSSSRNKGLDIAKGEFIQFLDADDYIFPEKFTIQIKDCLNNKTDISICDYVKSSNENLFVRVSEKLHRVNLNIDSPFLDLLFNWERNLSIPCHSFFFRKIIFDIPGHRFDPLLPNHEDIALWLNIFSTHPNFSTVNDVLAIYRTTRGGMTKNIRKMRSGYTEALKKLDVPQVSEQYIRQLVRRKINLVNYKVAFRSEILAKMFYQIQKLTGPTIINRFLFRYLPKEIQ